MVSKASEKRYRPKNVRHVKADIIVLGCSLPGIVAAHKLKKKFGDSMDIVVLDLVSNSKATSKSNVAFQDDDETFEEYVHEGTAKDLIDNIAKHYLNMYAKEFNIQLPDAIMAPEITEISFNKLFEYNNGQIVKCAKDFHDFQYLNVMERFELNQYQNILDESMKDLFQTHQLNEDAGREMLLYYDQTTMERHICSSLVFGTSREIMRNIVKLACGVPPHAVSVLFYLHQCYRTGSTKSHIDGSNTRLREKLLSFCRKKFTSKLQKSVANITLAVKAIKEICSTSDEEVILKPLKDDTVYVCNLLAMALKPDELSNIEVEDVLMSKKEREMITCMKTGTVKKVIIQYKDHFWREKGLSGDILSLKGPIIWATERPRLSSEGTSERYSSIIGYLKVKDNDEKDSKNKVISQLVRLLGEEAAKPVGYKEQNIMDIFVPRCGDYIKLQTLLRNEEHTNAGTPQLEWGALDIFAEGDMAAALEAGHTAYLHLVSFLRPQTQTYEDLRMADWPTVLNETNPFLKWLANLNFISTARILFITSMVYFGVRLIRHLRNQ